VTHDVLVLGGGAAGLFAAAVAGRRGRRVAVLERNRVPGRKILISGAVAATSPASTVGRRTFFRQSAFEIRARALHPADFIRLVRHGIHYHEDPGQLFCDGSSQEVLDLLLNDCRIVGGRRH
jgi:predicted flavoprotein YhiN